MGNALCITIEMVKYTLTALELMKYTHCDGDGKSLFKVMNTL